MQPNIIFIVADDMAHWTLSHKGSPNSDTPELDKIAKQGALLNNCFSSSAVCCPSRASLISGRYPSEAGLTDLIGLVDSEGLDLTVKTLPEVLKSNGYSTIMVGKWHLGEKEEYLPNQRGYDTFTGFPVGGMQSLSPKILVEGKWQVAEGEYTPDLLADYSMKYIKEYDPAITGKPFFLSLHFWAPHANVSFPEGMEPKYNGRSWLPMKNEDMEKWDDMVIKLPEPDFPNLDVPKTIRMVKEYHSSVHSVDRNVGRLMEFIKQLGIEENTIVIFTSDHGYMLGQHGLWHKGNGRWLTIDEKDPKGVYGNVRLNLYEHSMHVPCMIRYPKLIKPNTIINNLISDVDFFPTILEMTRINKPKDLLLRGKNFYPLLLGNRMKNTREEHFAQYGKLRAYRANDWKLIVDFSDFQRHELYNLKEDKEEHINLFYSSDKNGIKKKEESEKLLLQRMKEINDPLLNEFELRYQ